MSKERFRLSSRGDLSSKKHLSVERTSQQRKIGRVQNTVISVPNHVTSQTQISNLSIPTTESSFLNSSSPSK